MKKSHHGSRCLTSPIIGKGNSLFIGKNHITYGYKWQLTIHLVACLEEYDAVDKKKQEK